MLCSYHSDCHWNCVIRWYNRDTEEERKASLKSSPSHVTGMSLKSHVLATFIR